jgi:1-acyl-sn-glycerol-3-phosphate acyltransferase
VFLITGILNALVALYISLLVPEYLLRFAAFALSHTLYRFRVRGDVHVPTEGPAILASNHVSFVDAILLMGASQGDSDRTAVGRSQGLCRRIRGGRPCAQ